MQIFSIIFPKLYDIFMSGFLSVWSILLEISFDIEGARKAVLKVKPVLPMDRVQDVG